MSVGETKQGRAICGFHGGSHHPMSVRTVPPEEHRTDMCGACVAQSAIDATEVSEHDAEILSRAPKSARMVVGPQDLAFAAVEPGEALLDLDAGVFDPEAWDVDCNVVELDEADVQPIVPPDLPSPEAAAEQLVVAVRRRRAAEQALEAAGQELAASRAEEAAARAHAKAAMVNSGHARISVRGGRVVGVGRRVRSVGSGARVLVIKSLRVELD